MSLSMTKLLSLLAITGFSSAAAVVKRNPCDGVDASPELYHEYRTDVCPPRNRLDSDGSCPFEDGIDGPSLKDLRCAKYCEIRTNFFWGREQPFANTYCHGPLSCTITETKTRTVTWNVGGSLSTKVHDALTLGISGSYSQAEADAWARAFSIKLEEGQCGYFTFVPIIHDSCGSLTEGPADNTPGFPRAICSNDRNKWSTTGNFCQSQLKRHSDGTVDGDTIFVRTDCSTRAPLPADKQDDIYKRPGVALPRALQEAWANTFDQMHSGDFAAKGAIECAGGNADPLHACRALSAVQSDIEGEWTIPAGRKGDHHFFGDFPSHTNDPACSFYIDFLEDLDPQKCPINPTGLATLIDAVTDSCKDQGVFGSITLGGDCPIRLATAKRSWPEGSSRP
ncbi:hypothetical protein jhhlp_002898 [Lomentospora prolificans]|uniref:Ecp2 effector protein domain-containing protein n=1 Tax=Lomentospora prolificans TaxID=41688 RepID=A0A2N3NFG4_9PEZI|nr:hypothetical protein jhhlp_002898 [Lomentospora prolificans]